MRRLGDMKAVINQIDSNKKRLEVPSIDTMVFAMGFFCKLNDKDSALELF